MKRQILLLSSVPVIFVAAALAQGRPASAPPAAAGAAGSAEHGKEVFEANCAACHNADSTDTLVGPGLKGLSGRTFTVTNLKYSDDELVRWIKLGSNKMPPIGRNMAAQDVSDLVAYIGTL